jgi:adenosylcobinamide-GDP ribazoletransferase
MGADLYYTGIIFAIVVEIIVTGGLHFDGLADACDGLFSNRPGKEILEIMKDPRLGTSGALGIILVIMMKIAMLLSLNREHIIFVLIMMPAVSRMNILWSAGTSRYARKKGLGKSIIDHAGYREIAAATALTAIPGFLFLDLNIIPAIAFPALFALLFSRYASGKIGGITGDILGAVIEISEVVFLASMLFSERIFTN